MLINDRIPLLINLLSGLILFVSFFNTTYASNEASKNVNWTSWGGDYEGTRYSELKQINTNNVDQLKLVSTIPLKAKGNYVGGALIVDGLIYLQEPNTDTLYAYNQSTEKLQWSKQGSGVISVEKKSSLRNELELDSLGLTYSNNVIYWYQLSGKLLALHARTGKTLWEKDNTLEENLIGGTPPIVVGNKVIVGVADVADVQAGYKARARGYLTAYNVKNGDVEWRVYSYGTPNEVNYDAQTLIVNGIAQTSHSNFDTARLRNPLVDKNISGGVPAGWISYDQESNLIYYGTTSNRAHYFQDSSNRIYSSFFLNYAPQWDVLWPSSLWARDADSGQLVWIYQTTPNNLWGYDATNESILTDLHLDNKPIKALIHIDKNGFTFVLDRLSGKLMSASKIDDTVNWSKGINPDSDSNVLDTTHDLLDKVVTQKKSAGERYCPSMTGSKPFQPAAMSKKTGLIYIAGNRKCMGLSADSIDKVYDKSQMYRMSAHINYYHYSKNYYEPEYGGFLKAWDPETEAYVWTLPETYELKSGVLATQGGLTFYATLDGYFRAVDSLTGVNLYTFKMPMKSLGNISTWTYQGKQFIGLLIGANDDIDHRWMFYCQSIHTDSFNPKTLEDKRFEETVTKDLCNKPEGGAYVIFSLDASHLNQH